MIACARCWGWKETIEETPRRVASLLRANHAGQLLAGADYRSNAIMPISIHFGVARALLCASALGDIRRVMHWVTPMMEGRWPLID